MPVASSGISSAVPAFLQFALKIICGFVSDKVVETNLHRLNTNIFSFNASSMKQIVYDFLIPLHFLVLLFSL